MELFRPAGICRTDPDSRDWTREHGYAKASAFPFPDLYLDDKVAQLTREDPAVLSFLQQCLRQFVNHEYGHLSSLDLVENFLNRDVHQTNTWMRGNYPSPAWGESAWRFFTIWACSTWKMSRPGHWPWNRAARKPPTPPTSHETHEKTHAPRSYHPGRLGFLAAAAAGKVPSALGRAHGEHHHPAVSLRDYRRLLFLVDFLLLFLLELAGLYYLPASAVSFLVGISCNFLLTKFFAFKSVDPTVGPTAEVFVFAAISGGGLVLTMVLMYLFTSRLQLYFMVSKLISSILVFFWNFLGRKFILYPGKVHEHA